MEGLEQSLHKHSLQSAILYQNPEGNITLLDIPKSIALAQGRRDTLRSPQPPLKPIFVDTHVPKTAKGKQMADYLTDPPLHFEYKTDIEAALVKIMSNVKGSSWCLPRPEMAFKPNSTMSELDEEKLLVTRLNEWRQCKGEDETFDFQKMMATFGAGSETDATVTHPWLMSCRSGNGPVPQKEAWSPCFHNPEPHAVNLTIFDNTAQPSIPGSFTFRIPSKSTFFLGDVEQSQEFRASFRMLTEEYNLPRHFDFILMDPPWPSGSVKRKGNYEQKGGVPHMTKMLLKMDIGSYLEHNGLVGIWITNKKSLRDVVLGPGGLFESWNVGLIEEWIWIKTTTKGEPVFDLDSSWRKPYETLLLGRAAPNAFSKPEVPLVAKRRVIAAVPDVHSRKPCLKELIESLMSNPRDYSAMEVFSRYLVEGWTSWGTEVIKYNWDNYWVLRR